MSSEQAKNQEQKTYDIPYVLPLKYPITWGSEVKKEIVFGKRPKAKDFKSMQATDIRMADMIRIISSVTAEPVSFVEELDATDFLVACEVVNSFLSNGPTTGEA